MCNMYPSKKSSKCPRKQGQVDQMSTSTLANLGCTGNKVTLCVPPCSCFGSDMA